MSAESGGQELVKHRLRSHGAGSRVFLDQSKSVVGVIVGVVVAVEVGAVGDGGGGVVAVGEGVIVRVGVLVGVLVTVGVFVGSGVFVTVGVYVGVGNTTVIAERLMLHDASLNWTEKPKFATPRLRGGFMNEPAKRPSQSM